MNKPAKVIRLFSEYKGSLTCDILQKQETPIPAAKIKARYRNNALKAMHYVFYLVTRNRCLADLSDTDIAEIAAACTAAGESANRYLELNRS